jgi:hypothetical protein
VKALVLALSLVAAHRAHASSCHGGGGGGGSSGGGSSGGGGGGSYSSGSSSSGSSSSSGCNETTDVEGYRECHKFGEWAQSMQLPHMFVEMGGGMRRFRTLLPGRSGTVTHGDETFAYRVAMPGGTERSDVAGTFVGRILVGGPHGLYVGIEGEMGAVTPAAATTAVDGAGTFGMPSLEERGSLMIGGYGIAGVRVTGTRAALAIEAAGGVREVQYAWHSTYHDCEQTVLAGVGQGVVEARVRGEVRLSPWFTAGATAGASVLERGDFAIGLYLGMHTRSYR